MPDPILDCLIIGGGAAGLTAAVYLGRYRRRALVLDAGGSRLQKIPRTRNLPGFPEGIEGPELLARMREHARKYGMETVPTKVETLRQLADGSFRAESADGAWQARFVLLATGASDVEPQIEGIGRAVKAGQVRYCPICDGFETQGQRVAVLGREGHGMRESLFISGFGNEVTWLSMGTHEDLETPELAQLRQAGVRLADSAPQRIECGVDDCGVRVELQNGQVLEFDTLYPALGLEHASGLATALGARPLANGQLQVDAHQQTSVDGLYVAGDVAMDLNQISVATGHAAIAATADPQPPLSAATIAAMDPAASDELGRPPAGWRRRLYGVIFESDTSAGRAFDKVIIVLILVSVVVVIADSVPSLRQRHRAVFDPLEWLFTVLFTLEYLARIASVQRPLRYMRSFFGVVDLLSVLPTYLAILLPETHALIDVRVLRLLRIFRIFKLTDYVLEYQMLGEALAASRRKILVFLSAVLMVVLILGTLLYVVEGPEHGFTDIPTSVYWAITTITTVGFGDITPKTDIGRFIASVMMLIGWGTLAVPTGIVTAEMTARQHFQGLAAPRSCSQCGATGHAPQARYCAMCGAPLP